MNHDRYKENAPHGHHEHMDYDPSGHAIMGINEEDKEDTYNNAIDIAKKAEHKMDETPEAPESLA